MKRNKHPSQCCSKLIVVTVSWLLIGTAMSAEQICSYTTYSWNIRDKKPTLLHKVVKPKSSLTEEEFDPLSGCSVCEEDQVVQTIGKLPPFKVCRRIAYRVQVTLENLLRQGVPLLDIVGYRVGRTRGMVDDEGNRTEFSNHSFGVAVDINADANGLYDNCVSFGSDCRLIKGGVWNTGNEFSLTADSQTVIAFKSNGFKWGGEIAGMQKDFMHFSLTGY